MQQSQPKRTDRRSFLKGAALVGAGAAATGLVAACTPSSPGEGTSTTPAPTGGGETAPTTGWSWATPPEPIADADISETIETEIAVVGAGISGCAAACRASQLGAKVVVVEKQGWPSSRGGHYGGYQTKAMTREGLTNDPMDQIASEWLRFEGNRAKQKIIYRYLERSGEVIDWLEDYSKEFAEGGLIVAPIITHYVGPYYYEHIGTHVIFGPGSMMEGQGYPANENMINAPVYFMWKQAEAKGAQFLFNTPAEQLVQDSSGKVTGVVAKKEDGSYVKINASKGVLLASGDFSGDEEMREAYCDPISLKCDSFSYTPPGANTGDGQKMAMWAGAHMFLGEHCSPSMMHLIRYAMLCFGFMYVNTSGRRFMNEDTWIQAKSIRILQQPGDNSFAYSVFDGDYQQQVIDSLQYGGGQFWDNMSHMVGQPFDWGTPEDPFSPAGMMAAGLENGTVFQADTIADLAAQIGVEAAVLQEEVDKYNQWYDSGVDGDYHKRVELLTPIRTAPFYAVKFGPSNLVHPNGVEVNEAMQVLDEKLDPIPGLYASGNASGGRYGVDYPVVMNGNSHGSAMTFGYLVGEDLANA